MNRQELSKTALFIGGIKNRKQMADPGLPYFKVKRVIQLTSVVGYNDPPSYSVTTTIYRRELISSGGTDFVLYVLNTLSIEAAIEKLIMSYAS